MAFQTRFQDLVKFWVFIFLIFLKNLIQEYLYQIWGVADWEITRSGLFFTCFETFDWLLFWYYFRKSLDRDWKVVLMFIVTVIFTTIPDFLPYPIVGLDYDNLFIKSVLYFVPFAFFIVLKKSLKQIFLPVMMAFIPLVNLEIANGFEGNLSFLKVFFSNDFLLLEISDGVSVDTGLALVKSFFWAAFAILFFEMSNQFFGLRSWRLYVEMPLKKGWLFTVFVVFKALIYWFLGSLVIALLGANLLPLFTNKVGLLLNGIGFLGYLVICTLYFRKYMTMYFYDKCGHSNWLYPFFFLPFVDIIALVIILIFPPRHIKRFFSVKYSNKFLVMLVAGILVIYSLYSLWFTVLRIPATQNSLRNALFVAQALIPFISAIGIILSLKSQIVYKGLLTFLFLMLPVYFFYVVPNAESLLKVEQMVAIVSVYLNIGLSVAFLYPVVNFKSFLKLK